MMITIWKSLVCCLCLDEKYISIVLATFNDTRIKHFVNQLLRFLPMYL